MYLLQDRPDLSSGWNRSRAIFPLIQMQASQGQDLPAFGTISIRLVM